jgi:hypothetical protein
MGRQVTIDSAVRGGCLTVTDSEDSAGGWWRRSARLRRAYREVVPLWARRLVRDIFGLVKDAPQLLRRRLNYKRAYQHRKHGNGFCTVANPWERKLDRRADRVGEIPEVPGCDHEGGKAAQRVEAEEVALRRRDGVRKESARPTRQARHRERQEQRVAQQGRDGGHWIARKRGNLSLPLRMWSFAYESETGDCTAFLHLRLPCRRRLELSMATGIARRRSSHGDVGEATRTFAGPLGRVATNAADHLDLLGRRRRQPDVLIARWRPIHRSGHIDGLAHRPCEPVRVRVRLYTEAGT